MIFYDSYGKRVDVQNFDIEDYLPADRFFETDVKEHLNKADDFNPNNFLYRRDALRERLDIYRLKNIPDRTGTMEKHICGLALYRNPIDGQPCGISYYSCNKKEFDEDRMFEITYGRGFLCMSGNDSKNFPDMDKLMKFLIKEYDLDNKFIESVVRDNYILINETKCKFDNSDNYSDYRWKTYQETKKRCSNANYKNNRVNFKLKDGREGHLSIYKGDYDGLFIECMGRFYDTVNEALDDFEKSKGFDKEFGVIEGDNFKEYYDKDTPLTAEKVFDMNDYEEPEADEIDPFEYPDGDEYLM